MLVGIHLRVYVNGESKSMLFLCRWEGSSTADVACVQIVKKKKNRNCSVKLAGPRVTTFACLAYRTQSPLELLLCGADSLLVIRHELDASIQSQLAN